MIDHTIVTVTDVDRLTPHMVRVTLTADDLPEDYSTGIPDEYAKLVLPPPGTRHLPDPADDDVIRDGMRNYTIRRFDPTTRDVVVDLVVHEGGIGAAWASDARPGDRVGLTAPHGQYRLPDTVQWEILVGDATALPAIGRILEERTATHPIRAEVVVAGPEEEQTLAASTNATVRWHHVPDPHDVADALRDLVVGATFPSEPGYVWVAGEASACRDVRRHLRHELGWPGSAYCTLGYWRVDGERWTARYRQVEDTLSPRFDDLFARYEGQLDDQERFEDYLDEVEDLYDEHGL